MKACVLTNVEGGVGMPCAIEAMKAGKPLLDVVEQAIRVVEADPSVRSVGYGGWTNMLGEMECDAAIMCGTTLRAGAVGAVKRCLHPVSVARQVMERTAHVFLVGEGAERFAEEVGEPQREILHEASAREYKAWFQANVPGERHAEWPRGPLGPLTFKAVDPEKPKDTTTWLALSRDGKMAGGTSTSGWAYKHPGRLGDSPVIGAGLYVDDRYGGAMCTHMGEMSIRAGTARSIVLYMKKGAGVRDACLEAVADLGRLRGGSLGSLIIHAMDCTGATCVLAFRQPQNAEYWFWAEDMPAAVRRRAEPVPIA